MTTSLIVAIVLCVAALAAPEMTQSAAAQAAHAPHVILVCDDPALTKPVAGMSTNVSSASMPTGINWRSVYDFDTDAQTMVRTTLYKGEPLSPDDYYLNRATLPLGITPKPFPVTMVFDSSALAEVVWNEKTTAGVYDLSIVLTSSGWVYRSAPGGASYCTAR
jgi:hypothetical protein